MLGAEAQLDVNDPARPWSLPRVGGPDEASSPSPACCIPRARMSPRCSPFEGSSRKSATSPCRKRLWKASVLSGWEAHRGPGRAGVLRREQPTCRESPPPARGDVGHVADVDALLRRLCSGHPHRLGESVRDLLDGPTAAEALDMRLRALARLAAGVHAED